MHIMFSFVIRRVFTLFASLFFAHSTWAADTSMTFVAQPKVANGAPAISGQVPWQVALAVFDTDKQTFVDICSGTLVDKKWVVTAAHCFDGEADVAKKSELKFGIIVGTTDFQSEDESPQYFYIKQRILHPAYNKDAGMDGDIALIELDGAVDLVACGSACKVVSWADEVSDRRWDVIGQRVQIAGWGETAPDSYPLVLQVAPLQIAKCEQTNYGMNGKTWSLTDKMICAAAVSTVKPEDTCVGDSGSGLVVNAMTSQPILLGITSFGESADCGEARLPAIYTKVSSYDDWILSYVDPAAYAKRQQEKTPAHSSGGGGGGSFSIDALLMLMGLLFVRRYMVR